MAVDRPRIEANSAEILDAYNKKEWDRLLSHFAEDAVMYLPLPDGMKEVKGVQALREMYGQTWENPEVKSSSVQLQGFSWCIDELACIWKQVDVLTAGGVKESQGLSLVESDGDGKVTSWRDFFGS